MDKIILMNNIKKKALVLLKNFHLDICSFLISLIFLVNFSFPGIGKCEEEPNILIEPASIKLGDTVSVKVKKEQGTDKLPKIFFDKERIPTFLINNDQCRGLIPITAGVKPGKHSIDIFYGKKSKSIDLNISDPKYPIENLTLPKTVAGLKASKTEKDLVGKALYTVSNEKLWSGKFIFPSEAKQNTIYGVKRKINGTLDPDYFHKGLDFAAKEGASVKAPENGKVIVAGLLSKGFVVNGNCIFLDHGQGVVSAYLHLSSVLVKEGDLVKKGQLIGKVGGTGIASGPHLHWGIYVLGKPVEPLEWVSRVID